MSVYDDLIRVMRELPALPWQAWARTHPCHLRTSLYVVPPAIYVLSGPFADTELGITVVMTTETLRALLGALGPQFHEVMPLRTQDLAEIIAYYVLVERPQLEALRQQRRQGYGGVVTGGS